MRQQIEEILRFWFGPLKSGFPETNKDELWWMGTPSNDRLITELFGHEVRQALRGELDHWAEEPRGRLALILLLDQFTRTIFRGSADAFSGDHKALKLTLEGVHQGLDQALEFSERTFFYMPLEHAEDIEMQELCITCLEAMLLEVAGVNKLKVEASIDFAYQHHRQIEQFGRFPHRNDVLERSSTPEELAFLLQTKNRWGQ
ncbi:MAG: DUF924 domain-containing protein [Neptuniibacter sp.]